MTRLAAALLALLVAFAAPAVQAKDELVVGITQFPANFHPAIESMLAKSYILGMTRRPFTVYGPDWKLICMLCVDLPTIENGGARTIELPDGKKGVAVAYEIRPDARWGDGTPVTTEDVVHSWEVGRHPRSGVGNLEFFRSLFKVEVHDARRFTFHFDKLTFEYNAINGFDVLPAHVDRKYFADPEAYRRRNAYDAETTNPALYFGPYRIVAVTPGAHVVLELNPTWYGKKPHFKRIVVRTIENTAALEANLLSGAVDYVAGELGFNLEQALALEKRFADRFDVRYKAGLIYEHIDLNLDNRILKDVRVRRALIHALDRETLTRQLFDGRQPVAHTSVSPLDWVHDDEGLRYAYDPARAAALLDEAGWRMGTGGMRIDAKGDKLTLELMTTAGNRSRELVQQTLQSQWRRLGLDIRLRNEPARVFFGETVTRRRFPAMAMFAWVSSPENVPRTTLHSDHIPKHENNWAGQNYTGYANPEMDRLLERIDVELDREKRRAMWRRLQEIYAEDLPVLPLFYRADPFATPKWLTGIEPTGHQYGSSLWVEHWGVRP